MNTPKETVAIPNVSHNPPVTLEDWKSLVQRQGQFIDQLMQINAQYGKKIADAYAKGFTEGMELTGRN